MAWANEKCQILMVGGSEQICSCIGRLLPEEMYLPLLRVNEVQDTRQLKQQRVDLVILNLMKEDAEALHTAVALSEETLGVLLLVPAQDYESVCRKVEGDGVAVLAKPVGQQNLYTAIRVLTAMRARIRKMERKNETLQNKMSDLRAVNHAKWLLIERQNMTEDDAHHYIEKEAMDRRVSRRAVAENIIQIYSA